jgi:hypothetical protein
MQQFRQRVIASYHLGPLDRNETQGYIEHRLSHVGWKGDPQIEAAAYDAIFAFTAGIPRRVNLVCNRLMLAGFIGEMHVLTADDVETVVGEIKDELGVVSKEPAVRQGDVSEAGDGEGGVDAKPERSEADAETSKLSGPRPIADNEIEARLARLEKTLAVVLTLLRRLVRAVEPLEKRPEQVG